MVALNGTLLNGTVHLWSHPLADELDGELARLEEEVVAANERASVAEDRAAARDAEVRAMLRAELIASRDAIAEMERQHRLTLAMVRAAAQAEVERILAEARQRAASQTGGALSAQWAGVNDAE